MNVAPPPSRATDVVVRGFRASPELRAGLRSCAGLALASSLGKLIVPLVIRQIIDHDLARAERVELSSVAVTCAAAALAVIVVMLLNRLTYRRLVTAAQATLYGLRTRAFARIHELSIAHHDESKRGVLVTRVTSDIETLAQFAQWGAVAWLVDGCIIVVTLAVIAVISWQLALVCVVTFGSVVPALLWLQRRELAAYDRQRSAVATTLTEISETVMGAPVIRAYGLGSTMRARLGRAIDDQYGATMLAARYYSLLFTLADLVAGIAVGLVIGAGVWWGPGWGMDKGSLVACIFLVTMLLGPIGELGEVLDQTQTALAGWRKVLDLLDSPVDVIEPARGVTLRKGALGVDAESVSFEYLRGEPVLCDVELHVEAGEHVALVGETGSGKTTFAKLLARLADPTSGTIRVDGVDLRSVDPVSRAERLRMVPQDGFLFDATIRENIAMGRRGATSEEVEGAIDRLGLRPWVERVQGGLDARVGERGDALSVGERQLVALARAEIADAGLLVLDEATSAVDPETERSLAQALTRLSQGRTVVSVAHRLSIAESADRIVVFDHGRVVATGSHAELVAAGGVYGRLHASWLGGTRTVPGAATSSPQSVLGSIRTVPPPL